MAFFAANAGDEAHAAGVVLVAADDRGLAAKGHGYGDPKMAYESSAGRWQKKRSHERPPEGKGSAFLVRCPSRFDYEQLARFREPAPRTGAEQFRIT